MSYILGIELIFDNNNAIVVQGEDSLKFKKRKK